MQIATNLIDKEESSAMHQTAMCKKKLNQQQYKQHKIETKKNKTVSIN
jgi:hypothetical protein